ncbi:hypothetical protein AVEN_1333-1 [Araneus ventricosus]|uniref:Uncharacterized protein n=1 Tax=Araneus ventricosus TaxID=182803 RepID=A0A4Y2D4X4_ARAVE|nr:hypothetical protein AVEN_1333-1 [Araneus ventricosus]
MINKPRATSNEGNLLKKLKLRSGKTAVISTTTEAMYNHRCGVALLCWHSRSVGLDWSGGNAEGTPIYIWMNGARAELHLFSILHARIKIPPATSWQSERSKM